MKRNINNQVIYYNNVKVNEIPQFVFYKDIELLSQRLILIDQNYNSNIFNIDYSKRK